MWGYTRSCLVDSGRKECRGTLFPTYYIYSDSQECGGTFFPTNYTQATKSMGGGGGGGGRVHSFLPIVKLEGHQRVRGDNLSCPWAISKLKGQQECWGTLFPAYYTQATKSVGVKSVPPRAEVPSWGAETLLCMWRCLFGMRRLCSACGGSVLMYGHLFFKPSQPSRFITLPVLIVASILACLIS